MSQLIAQLVDGSRSARRVIDEEIDRSLAGPGGGELIDQLASAAGTSPAALEALLGTIQRHGLAQAAIRSLLTDEDDVDDVEQSVLAVVAFRVGGFRGDARFTTWLHRVARNEALMLLRTRSRRPATDTIGDGPEPIQVGYLGRLSSLVGDRDLVDRALDALPTPYREVLVLREVDGLEYAEIARRLDIAVGTVRSRLHKARELVAGNLGPGLIR